MQATSSAFLTKLARTLITTDSDDDILEHVMAIAFEVLPVDRGFILLRDESGELGCELMRTQDRVELHPEARCRSRKRCSKR